jgi:hypothetical protein
MTPLPAVNRAGNACGQVHSGTTLEDGGGESQALAGATFGKQRQLKKHGRFVVVLMSGTTDV